MFFLQYSQYLRGGFFCSTFGHMDNIASYPQPVLSHTSPLRCLSCLFRGSLALISGITHSPATAVAPNLFSCPCPDTQLWFSPLACHKQPCSEIWRFSSQKIYKCHVVHLNWYFYIFLLSNWGNYINDTVQVEGACTAAGELPGYRYSE